MLHSMKKRNKSLFTGYGSFGSQISQKASAISSAAARTKGVDKTYNKNGAYSDTISKLFQSTIDERVGSKNENKDKVTDKSYWEQKLKEEKDKDKNKND